MNLTKCCVCNQEAPCFQLKSTCSDNIMNYCAACISNGYENYTELINYGFPHDLFSRTFRNKVLIPSLRYYGKTVEQFNADVLKGEKNDGTDSC